jgi:hypothetical protein
MACRLDCPPQNCLHPSSGCGEIKMRLTPRMMSHGDSEAFDEVHAGIQRLKREKEPAPQDQAPDYYDDGA